MEITYNADHIMVVDGVFDQALCDEIIKRFDADPKRAQSWSTKNNQKQYREGKCLTISREAAWQEIDQRMYQQITKAVDLYLKRYVIQTPTKDVGYTIAEMEPGEKTNPHIDSIHGASAFRLVTIILYLNKPESGGETALYEQNYECKPEPGRLLMFPPFYTHPHGSNPATSKRYILVSWVHSDPALYTPGDHV